LLSEETVPLTLAGALLTVLTTELTGLCDPPPLPEPSPDPPLLVPEVPPPPPVGVDVGCDPPPEPELEDPPAPCDPDAPDPGDPDPDEPLDDPPPLDFGAGEPWDGDGEDGVAVELELCTTVVAATGVGAGTCRRKPAWVAEVPPP